MRACRRYPIAHIGPPVHLISYSTRSLMIDGAAHHRVALPLKVCFFCPDSFLLEPEEERRNGELAGFDFGTELTTF